MLFIPKPETELQKILEYYVETVSIRKKSYKSEVYRIRPLVDVLGELLLCEITPQHVVAYRDKRLSTANPRDPSKMLGPATVKHELMLLSHVFTMAITEWGMEGLANPVERIRKPKTPPGRTRRMTPAEERRLIKAALKHPNPELYAIIVLALETSMRQGEILGLRWENVSWRKRTVFLPDTKNGDPREVPLSIKAYGILKTHLTPRAEGRVFHYTSNGLKSSWRYMIQSLEIEDLHFHDLRHCAISSLLERGLNTIEVATISGHRTMSMLKRYAHLSAHLLVKKLDPKPIPKRERPLLREHFPSYPVVISEGSTGVEVDFPDFIDLAATGPSIPDAIEGARARLLKRVVNLLCDGGSLPSPSPVSSIYLPTNNSRIEVISPI
ncbi:MAG TPA: site-specific integrase [Rhodocyclaceae bacterium]|jgi:integrase